MELLLIAIALVTLGYSFFTAIEFVIGFNQLRNLNRQKDLPREQLPTVTIVFGALNEEKVIEKTLRSLLMLDYPNLEIIAINDRSTDSTPAILDRIQQEFPALRVFHVDKLPEGWFGKNHALHYGSSHAIGEWILFTDADVIMKENTLIKAMSYTLEKRLDHLTIFENHIRPTFWLGVLLLANYLTYSIARRPWRVRYSWSKCNVGHAAFNLVKKESYLKCDGHSRIALECLDDMKLGELMKKNKYRQDTVDGRDFVEREWYSSLADMIEGWKKNSFAYFNYSLLTVFRDFSFAFLFFIWPVIAVFICSEPLRFLNMINVALTLFLSFYVAKKFRLEKVYAFFYPCAVSILLYSICKSAISIYKQKGVIWRGTHYPLHLLRNAVTRNKFN